MSFWAPLVSMESNLAEGQGNGSTWGRKTPINISTKEKLERRCYPCWWHLTTPPSKSTYFCLSHSMCCQGWKSGMRAHGSMVETTQGRREALQRWKGDWIWVFKEHGRDLKLEQPGDYGLGKDLGRYCGNFLVRESFKCHRQDVLRSTTEICEVLLVLHKEQTTCDWRACSFKCWENFFWKVCLSIL